MNRQFFNRSIEALEAEFAERQADGAFLRTLLDELEFRSTNRAARLRSRVAERLSGDEVVPHETTAKLWRCLIDLALDFRPWDHAPLSEAKLLTEFKDHVCG